MSTTNADRNVNSRATGSMDPSQYLVVQNLFYTELENVLVPVVNDEPDYTIIPAIFRTHFVRSVDPLTGASIFLHTPTF
jgi:hypothetical protein